MCKICGCASAGFRSHTRSQNQIGALKIFMQIKQAFTDRMCRSFGMFGRLDEQTQSLLRQTVLCPDMSKEVMIVLLHATWATADPTWSVGILGSRLQPHHRASARDFLPVSQISLSDDALEADMFLSRAQSGACFSPETTRWYERLSATLIQIVLLDFCLGCRNRVRDLFRTLTSLFPRGSVCVCVHLAALGFLGFCLWAALGDVLVTGALKAQGLLDLVTRSSHKRYNCTKHDHPVTRMLPPTMTSI